MVLFIEDVNYFPCSGGKSSLKLTQAVLVTSQLHTVMKKSYITFGKCVHIIIKMRIHTWRNKINLTDS